MNVRNHRAGLASTALIALCSIAVTSAQVGAVPSTLPTYPGATKTRSQASGPVSMCGHKVSIVSYESGADAMTVAKWYESKISGASTLDLSETDSGTIDNEIFMPDGSQGAVIHQLIMTNAKLQAASKSIGADKTGFGLTTYAPPLGAEYLSLAMKAHHGDASAKRALTAKCPQD
jgi:hypothetical protein